MTLEARSVAPAVVDNVLAGLRVTVVGCGGSHHLATSLARFGVRDFQLIDPDIVQPENLSRSDFLPADIGEFKVTALGRSLEQFGASVQAQSARFQDLPEQALAGAALVIATTDSFAAQAAVNRFAVQNRTAALFCGLAAHGLGGEIVFWYPGLPCFRCLVSRRYELFERPAARLDRVAGDGATLFDITLLDAIAGQIAVGLLLRGSASRFGELLEILGDRNYLRLKIDPRYRQGGRDCVGLELGIAPDNEQFTGWCLSAQRDPARGEPPCPDCAAADHQPGHEPRAVPNSAPPFFLPGRLNKQR